MSAYTEIIPQTGSFSRPKINFSTSFRSVKVRRNRVTPINGDASKREKGAVMRIMLLGANGFIGRHLLSDLLAHGHDMVAVVRRVDGIEDAYPGVHFIEMDLADAVSEAVWAEHLPRIELIVNAAGLLRGPDMTAVHEAMPKALYAAAAHAGVRRAILLSAISARPDVPTDYAQSKLQGEAVLRSSGLDWTIMRPSLVYGDGSYGGTSLMRGMAGLPGFVTIPGKGDFAFTPIHASDLARAVRISCEDDCFAGQVLEPVGPSTMDLRDMLAQYRSWLGFGRPRFISIPMPVMRLFGKMGDLLGDGPMATNSLVQMVAGNAGDSKAFEGAIGFAPRSLETALRDRPAQVQDRWHARLFFLAPALKAVLVLMWIASALLGLFYGAAQADELVRSLGWSASLADPLRIGGSLLDLGIAALLILDRRARWSTLAQLVMVCGYTLVIGLALPQLWLDPLGPLLKNIPILIAILVHGAIGDKR